MSRATAGGFLTHAREFLSAGELLLKNTRGVSLPAYFLLGRSIELSLKAFLLACEVKPSELKKRKFGHDLQALLDAALERGIGQQVRFRSVEIGIIGLLNCDYMEKRFEYRETGGTYRLPIIEMTVDIARKLAIGLEKFCSQSKL